LVLGAAGAASGEGGVTGYKQGQGGSPVSGAADRRSPQTSC
jgi:hypothetical protein